MLYIYRLIVLFLPIISPTFFYAQSCDLDTEDFESGATPLAWQNTGVYIGTNNPYQGTYFAGFNTAGDQLIVEPLDCPGEICFYWRASGFSSDYDVDIDWSDDNGATWNTVQTISLNGSGSPTTYSQTCVDLPENLYAPPFEGILIRFHQSRRNGGSFYLDDVCVSLGICSLTPTELQFSDLSANCISANVPFSLEVCATDASGFSDPSYNGIISLSKSSGVGILGGTLSQTAVNGCATFNDLSLSQAGFYDLAATDGSLVGSFTNLEVLDQCPLTDTIRAMAYNLLNFPNGRDDCGTNTVVPDRWDSLAIIMDYVQADILMACELQTEAGADSILSRALNVNGETAFQRAAFVSNQSNGFTGLNNMVFYNSDKLVLYRQDEILTTVRDIGHYTFYLNDPNLSSTQDTNFLDVYVGHLKAGSADAAIRASACDSLRKYVDTASVGRNAIFGGDFNFYSSSEAGYQSLLGGVYPFFDPINTPGDWSSDFNFAGVHTQSTRITGTSLDCGAQGGMDDRFDFILASASVMNQTNQIGYINNSYQALGNDGSIYNDAVNDPANSSNVPSNILNALHNTSDHLPVIMDMEVTYSSPVLNLNLLSFEGRVEGDYDILNWSVENPDRSTLELLLEYSENAVDFEVLKSFNSTTEFINMDYSHLANTNSISYYRLKIRDAQSVEYSSVIVLRRQAPNLEVYNCYPNPVQDQLHIDFKYLANHAGELELRVYNSLGQLVVFERGEAAAARQQRTISTSQLAEGSYIIELRLNKELAWRHQFVKY